MEDSAVLIWGLLFGSIGIGYFVYGKKQKHKVAFYAGLGLMVYPYCISDPLLLVLGGAALMAAPFFIT